MNPAEVPLKAPVTAAVFTAGSDVTDHDVEKVERALIDASTRLPVLFFYASAIAWLLLGTILAGFTSTHYAKRKPKIGGFPVSRG